MAKESKPQEPTPYQIDYRNVEYPRLEFKTGSLLLVLPRNYENEMKIIEKHKDWIHKKEQIIRRALEEAKEKDLILTRTDEELKNQVHSIVERYQQEFNINIHRIYFKKMKTKWGSYSSKNNLTINTLLKYLPERLIHYIIFHELAHSREKRHNERFWKIIRKKFEDYQTKEKNLLAYWFLVQKHNSSVNESFREI